MGSNSTQALGVTLFLAGFTFISSSLAAGGSMVLLALGLAALGGSAVVLYKIKPWEHKES